MKKLFFLLAAVAGLTLASCTTTEDTVYIISDTVSSHSIAGASGDGYDIYEDFENEIIAWDKNGTSAWQWVLTTKNGKYSDADAQVKAKFNQYLPEFQAIFAKYQAKFDACQDPYFSVNQTNALKLTRVGNGVVELESKECTLKYN